MNSAPRIPDHELLCRIGRGSYGEVWLGKSVTGAYRAIKVIYRDSFDHERPYEREFAGIKKFEPISRNSDTQVDILHVGRNDAEGFFYYVMELADDQKTGTQINPADYTPRTLRSELYVRGRLPLQECLDIGVQLTTALEHLHGSGLIHRDIKPSNIVFVNGTPKLADVGLVTTIDATRTYVGTEGYIPAEGPGTTQADLYGLGKVLYEISTGRDRLDFPELPSDLRVHPEREALVQLNEVILKACHEDRTHRYTNANEMRQDLLALKAGQPLVHTKPARNWKPLAGAISLMVVLAIALIVGILKYQQSHIHNPSPNLQPTDKPKPQGSGEMTQSKVLDDVIIIGSRKYQRHEFQINTGSIDHNSQANLAVLENGNILATWHQGGYKISVTATGGQWNGDSLTTLNQGKAYWHCCGQIFNPQCSPSGSVFLLTPGRLDQIQWGPSPAPLPGGGFVVAFGESSFPSGGSAAQCFDSSCKPAGHEYELGLPDWTSVASYINGDFVAVGTHAVGSEVTNDWPFYARRFNASGIPYGAVFQVGTVTKGYATASASYGSDGRFAFAWPSHTHQAMVRAYRSSELSPFGAEFPANSTSTSLGCVSARYNSKNDLVVIWSGTAGLETNAVYVRRFDSNMAAEGSEWKVNETAPANYWRISLSIGANDESIISWDSGTNIYARLLDRSGNPIGHEFRVNQFKDGKHDLGWEACLHSAILKNGNLVFGWAGSGASGDGVYLTVLKFITNTTYATVSQPSNAARLRNNDPEGVESDSSPVLSKN